MGAPLPSPAANLDWSNPLVRGLIEIARPVSNAVRTYVLPGFAALTGGDGRIGRGGPARAHTATADRTSFITDGSRLPTGACTLMVWFSRRSATLAQQLTASNAEGGDGGPTYPQRFALAAPWGNTPFDTYFDYGGLSNGTTRVTASGLSYVENTPYLMICTVGPRGMEIWRDGVRVGSNGANPTRTASTGYFGFGGAQALVGGDPYDDYYLGGVWNRQLSQAEVRQLSNDPWQLFLDARRKTVFAAPPSGNTATGGAAQDNETAGGAAALAIDATGGASGEAQLAAGTSLLAIAATGAGAQEAETGQGSATSATTAAGGAAQDGETAGGAASQGAVNTATGGATQDSETASGAATSATTGTGAAQQDNETGQGSATSATTGAGGAAQDSETASGTGIGPGTNVASGGAAQDSETASGAATSVLVNTATGAALQDSETAAGAAALHASAVGAIIQEAQRAAGAATGRMEVSPCNLIVGGPRRRILYGGCHNGC